jgi:hypothetical protein
MSIVEDLKTEAAKLLAEAEKVEKEIVAAVEKPVEVVEADVKAEVEPTPTPTPAPTPAAKPVAKATAKPAGSKTICGVTYASDGLTIEWKER